jgi:hypothetical protein
MAAELTMPPPVFPSSTETGFIFDLAPGAFCREQVHRRDCRLNSKAVAWRTVFFCRCRCCILVFTAIVLIQFIQGCTAAQIRGNSADRLAADIRSLVNHLAKSPCSLQQVEDILGGTTSYLQEDRYAIIKSPQHNTIAAIKDDHGENVVTELMIYPQSETDLQFKDLQGVMADCRIVPERKSSALVFQRVSADRKIIVDLNVTLLFPPTDPKSRVVSIRIKVNSSETPEG